VDPEAPEIRVRVGQEVTLETPEMRVILVMVPVVVRAEVSYMFITLFVFALVGQGFKHGVANILRILGAMGVPVLREGDLSITPELRGIRVPPEAREIRVIPEMREVRVILVAQGAHLLQ